MGLFMSVLDSILDSETVGIYCKNCGNETARSIRWVMDHNKFTCSCSTVISLKSVQFKRDFNSAERSLNDFEKGQKKPGK